MAEGRRRRSASRATRAGIADAERVIDAALALVAAEGWRNVSLAAVASDAGLSVLEVYRVFPSRTAILCGFFRRIDEAVLVVPARRSFLSKVCSGVAVRLDRLQMSFAQPHANWIHVVFSKDGS